MNLIGRDTQLDDLRSRISAGHSFALVGAAGVGKTALLRELTQDLDDRVRTFHASAGLTAVPLGLFASLHTSETTSPDPMSLLVNTKRALLDQRDDIVVFIDDLQLADPMSTSLLHDLLRSREATVVATVRTTSPVTPEVRSLWTDGSLERIEVLPLDRIKTTEAAAGLLGGTLSPDTETKVWEMSRGNPLFLTELLRGAVESGTLVEREGTWQTNGNLTSSTRITDVVSDRLHTLSQTGRETMQVLSAAAVSLPQAALEDASSPAGLTALVTAGLVEFETESAKVRLTHPMYGEVTHAQMSHQRRQDVLLKLLRSLDSDSDIDPISRGRWAVECQDDSSTELLVRAAAAARDRFDFDAAHRFAAAAYTYDQSFEIALLAASADLWGEHADRGEREVDRLSSIAVSDEERFKLAQVRAAYTALRKGEFEAALSQLDSIEHALTEPRWKSAAIAERSTYMIFGPLFASIGPTVGPLIDDENLDDDVLERLIFSLSAFYAFTCNPQANRDVYNRWLRLWESRRVEGRIIDTLPAGALVASLTHAGEFDEARSSVSWLIRELEEAKCYVLADAMELMVTFARFEQGYLDESVEALQTGLSQVRRADPAAIYPDALVRLAFCQTLRGQVPEAEDLLAELESLPAERRFIAESRRLRTRGFLIARRDMGTAISLLQEAVEVATFSGHTFTEAMHHHEFTRLGRPDLAIDGLERLSSGFPPESRPQLWLGHTQALLANDALRLEECSALVEQRGSIVVAAEIAAQARDAFEADGRTASAMRAGEATRRLKDLSGAVASPALLVSPKYLTTRETEVARLVASGLSNREVAEQLGSSKRTIDNQMSSVYSKLGINGRSGLTEDMFDLDS